MFNSLRFPEKGSGIALKILLEKKISACLLNEKKIFFCFKDLEPTPLFLRRIIKLIRQRINLASGI